MKLKGGGGGQVLTKKPKDNALLKEALVMVAPLSALKLCRYMVKITPGNKPRSTILKVRKQRPSTRDAQNV